MFDIYLRKYAEAQSTGMVDDINIEVEVAMQSQSITVEEYSRLLLIGDIAYRACLWMESAYNMVGRGESTTP